MNKPKFETPDMTQKNIEKIEQLFPNCITESKDENGKLKKAVNFELLQQILSGDIADKDEAYEFTWVGKNAAIVEANKPIRKTLRPCKEESVNWDTTENLYIEGDNLEVLKLLQESYLGKVKMIYIDPPYNTGNDFIYRDDFAMDREEYAEEAGFFDEDGNRMFKNTDSNGRFHSDWCSMIYSRLLLARNLLSDDGVIFISIDDNEVENLKKVCDEVFGEGNFVAEFPWRKRTAKSDVPFGVSQDYEWIVCYSRSLNFKASIEGKERNYFETEDFPDKPWRFHDLTTQRTINERPNSNFTMVNPKTKEEFPVNPLRCWAVTKETFDEYYQQNRIIFPGDYDFLNISKPVLRYWKEDDIKKAGEDFGRIAVSTKLPDEIGMSQDGTKEITELFDGKVFSYPKPTSLLKFLIKIATQNSELSTNNFQLNTNNFKLKSNNSPIILDFFSGSATTAHAVIQLNAEDGGNRKFIMVQLPEKCDESSEAFKAGYKNICEIGKERIRRAGRKIVESEKLKVETTGVESTNEGEKNGKQLSGFDSLAKGDGFSSGDLFSGEEVAERGDVRAVGSNAAGCSVDSVEHSGGTGAQLSEGVHSVPSDSERLNSRTGNSAAFMRENKLSDGNRNSKVNESNFRSSENDFIINTEVKNKIVESGKLKVESAGVGSVGVESTVVESLKLKVESGGNLSTKNFQPSTKNTQPSTKNFQLSTDIGFRVLKVDDSNMKDVYYSALEYDQSNLDMFESNIKEDRTDLDLLFGCLLDWGLPLSLPYTSETIEKFTVHTYNNGDLIACFDSDVSESLVKEIARKKPLRAVFRDSSFSNSASKINVFEIFKMISPKTSVKVI